MYRDIKQMFSWYVKKKKRKMTDVIRKKLYFTFVYLSDLDKVIYFALFTYCSQQKHII